MDKHITAIIYDALLCPVINKNKMKKIAIKLEYKDKMYISDYTEMNEEQEDSVKNLLEKAAQGELTYITFECQNIQQYFTRQILEQSILGLVYGA